MLWSRDSCRKSDSTQTGTEWQTDGRTGGAWGRWRGTERQYCMINTYSVIAEASVTVLCASGFSWKSCRTSSRVECALWGYGIIISYYTLIQPSHSITGEWRYQLYLLVDQAVSQEHRSLLVSHSNTVTVQHTHTHTKLKSSPIIMHVPKPALILWWFRVATPLFLWRSWNITILEISRLKNFFCYILLQF